MLMTWKKTAAGEIIYNKCPPNATGEGRGASTSKTPTPWSRGRGQRVVSGCQAVPPILGVPVPVPASNLILPRRVRQPPVPAEPPWGCLLGCAQFRPLHLPRVPILASLSRCTLWRGPPPTPSPSLGVCPIPGQGKPAAALLHRLATTWGN